MKNSSPLNAYCPLKEIISFMYPRFKVLDNEPLNRSKVHTIFNFAEQEEDVQNFPCAKMRENLSIYIQ